MPAFASLIVLPTLLCRRVFQFCGQFQPVFNQPVDCRIIRIGQGLPELPHFTSCSTRMASSTWLRDTLPLEHAAPALTEMPPNPGPSPRFRRADRQARTACIRQSGRRPRKCECPVWQARKTASMRSRLSASAPLVSARPHSPGGKAEADNTGHIFRPPRRPSSCPPPVMEGGTTSPARTNVAPTPMGPPILCADTASASHPKSSRLSGIFPAACTPSQKQTAMRPNPLGNLANGLQNACFIIGHHHAH